MCKFVGKIFEVVLSVFVVLVLVSIIECKVNEFGDNEVGYVFLGNSHIEHALNDSLISHKTGIKAINYGAGGQSLFWTVACAKKLKRQGVKRFVINYDEISFTTGYKTFDDYSGRRNLKYYKSFLEIDDWLYLFKIDFRFGVKAILTFPFFSKSPLGRFTKRKKDFYNGLTKFNRQSEIDCTDNVLVDFIKKNPDLQFYLIKTPFHESYYKMQKYEHLSSHLRKRQAALSRFENVRIIDFGHYFDGDAMFLDYSHLNSIGALWLSEAVAMELNTPK